MKTEPGTTAPRVNPPLLSGVIYYRTVMEVLRNCGGSIGELKPDSLTVPSHNKDKEVSAVEIIRTRDLPPKKAPKP